MKKDNFNCNNSNKHYFSNSSFCTSCYNPYTIKHTLQFLIDSNIAIVSGHLISNATYYPQIDFSNFSDIEIKGDLIYIYDQVGVLDSILPICNLLGIEFEVLSINPLLNILSNYSPSNTTCNAQYCCNNAMSSILTVDTTYPRILFNLLPGLYYSTVIYSSCDILWLEGGTSSRDDLSSYIIRIFPMYLVSYVSNTPLIDDAYTGSL